MTRRDEILRRIDLKRQAMRVLEEAHKDRMAELRAEISGLSVTLRELDYAERAKSNSAAA